MKKELLPEKENPSNAIYGQCVHGENLAICSLCNGIAIPVGKIQWNVAWEIFLDDSYFGFWAVRPVGDKDFNSLRLFHFKDKKDAELFKRLIEKSILSVPYKVTEKGYLKAAK